MHLEKKLDPRRLTAVNRYLTNVSLEGNEGVKQTDIERPMSQR